MIWAFIVNDQKQGLCAMDRSVYALSFLLLAPHVISVGQDSPRPSLSAEFKDLRRDMKSEEWKARRDSFYRMIRLGSPGAENTTYLFASALQKLIERNPGESDAIKMSLIELLQKENAVVKACTPRDPNCGEEYSNYYGDVIGAVGGLKDPRAIPALIGAMNTGGMAVQGLAEFGRAALGPVLSVFQDHKQDEQLRMGAVSALGTMILPPYSKKLTDPESRLKIKQALLQAATDESFGVRLSAVSILGALADPDAIPILERLAREDPVILPGKPDDGGDGGKFYPLRQNARRALARLKSSLDGH